MNFLDKMKEDMSKTKTENGANTYTTSLNANVDFFAQAGAMRNRQGDIKELFQLALDENKKLAIYNLIHLRNVRLGGLGERDAFRESFKAIIENDVDLAVKLLPYIPFVGRWDDVVNLWWFAKNERGMGFREFEEEALNLINASLTRDSADYNFDKEISLLAKWLPSESASNKAVKQQAKTLANDLRMSKKEYRKTLSTLRNHINIIETNLTKKDYDSINLEQVPSRAMFKYRTALHTHLGDRMEQYIEDVSSGEKKMNTSNMLPHEIASKGLYGGGITRDLEVMWENLDNTLEVDDNALVMADVSGSMYGTPMAVSVGLAIYIAERIQGDFKDHFMTFSANPQLVHIPSTMTLDQKIDKARGADWGMNTDLNKAFEKILHVAVENNMAQEDIPSKLIVISDMEFDESQDARYNWKGEIEEYSSTTHEILKSRYESEGYKLPQVVYWNVDSRQSNVPVRHNEAGVALVSGFTPNILRGVIGKDLLTPEAVMLDVLSKEEYSFLEEIL